MTLVLPGMDLLRSVRTGHPRLLVLPADLARCRHYLAEHAPAQDLAARLLQRGEQYLLEPPPERPLERGAQAARSMLELSRLVLDRVYTLGMLYQLHGSWRWAERAVTELLTVAGFEDWCPQHGPVLAEMLHAVAIGYDWLYELLTPRQRADLRGAMLEKGLRVAEQAYAQGAGWLESGPSWRIAGNAAVVLACLALADELPELTGPLLAQAIQHLSFALRCYAPDGAWAEGPAAWSCATRYVSIACAALHSALGSDVRLSEAPGLERTGFFRLHTIGPTGRCFNFADAGEEAAFEPALFWLARRYNQPLLAYAARQLLYAGRGTPTAGAEACGLLWYDPRGSSGWLGQAGLEAHFTATQLACLRASWTDPQALFVGLKGGDNHALQAHLDCGSFVLEALGQRWAIDLGGDDISLPGYWDQQRWSYYRLSTAGHNTLVLGGENQDLGAAAALSAVQSAAGQAFALVDLSAAYAGAGARRVRRGLLLLAGRSAALLQDELDLARPVEIGWRLHTRAEVVLDGSRARLMQGGVLLEAQLLAPEGASFTVEEVRLAPPQQPTPDVRCLQVRLPAAALQTRIAVLFQPAGVQVGDIELLPLDHWRC